MNILIILFQIASNFFLTLLFLFYFRYICVWCLVILFPWRTFVWGCLGLFSLAWNCLDGKFKTRYTPFSVHITAIFQVIHFVWKTCRDDLNENQPVRNIYTFSNIEISRLNYFITFKATPTDTTDNIKKSKYEFSWEWLGSDKKWYKFPADIATKVSTAYEEKKKVNIPLFFEKNLNSTFVPS